MTPGGSKTKTFSVTPTETRVRCNLHEFNELVGPIRAFDGSATEASRIFPELFYSDNVFAKIADFTNANGNTRNKYNQARLLDFRVAHGAMYFCRFLLHFSFSKTM